MGGFCTPSYSTLPSSSETVAGTEIPAWVAAAGRTAFERAAEIADSPYPLYTGQRTATYGDDNSRRTDEEIKGYNILMNGAESYMPYMNRAGEVADTLGQGYDGMTQEELLGSPFQGATREELLGDYQGASREDLLGDPFSLDSAKPYMDIYQSAMDPAVREIEQQTLRAQQDARDRAAQGGGAFGSRLGIMEGTAAGRGSQAAGDLRAGAAKEGLGFAAGRYDTDRAARATEQQMRSSNKIVPHVSTLTQCALGFEQDRSARFGADSALRGQYDTDRQARFGADTQARQAYETNEASRIQQMDAYQSMAPLVQDLQTQAAAGLIGAGEARRQLDQQALDLAYADYLDQKMYPQEMLNFTLGALSGTPYNTINRSYTTGSQMTANPSLFGQTLAGMGGLASAYKLMNN
jgi:hypothetical protein